MKSIRIGDAKVGWQHPCAAAAMAGFVEHAFAAFRDTLPDPALGPAVLVKPNCNNDLHWLTGSFTDLRLIAAVIDHLRALGYPKIALGDGPNVGVHRLGIDVFSRLGLASLARAKSVDLIDLNRAPSVEVSLGRRYRVRVARPALEADLVINLPKLKTHQEAGLSLATKNCMGCVTGLQKKTIHEDLFGNLAQIGLRIAPRMNILDGIVAMEGNGPGDGTPRRVGLLAASDDPFALDAVVGRLVGFELPQLPLTREAIRIGRLAAADMDEVAAIVPLCKLQRAPPRTLLSRIIGHNRLTWARDLCRGLMVRPPLLDFFYAIKVIQDIYETAEPSGLEYHHDPARCTGCGRCESVCPMGLVPWTQGFAFSQQEGCIQCKSCFFACPHRALRLEGELGYLGAHLRRYGELLRGVLETADASDPPHAPRERERSSSVP